MPHGYLPDDAMGGNVMDAVSVEFHSWVLSISQSLNVEVGFFFYFTSHRWQTII